MSAYPARRGKARTPLHVVRAKTAAGSTDELLLEDHAQLVANITGTAVRGKRPQFYGLPKAKADSERHLPIIVAELKRRGIDPERGL